MATGVQYRLPVLCSTLGGVGRGWGGGRHITKLGTSVGPEPSPGPATLVPWKYAVTMDHDPILYLMIVVQQQRLESLHEQTAANQVTVEAKRME